jgi:hypothetical protein
MCREIIGIAMCAHAHPPAVLFTCGGLHNVAIDRSVCDDAKSDCICYFGTCGSVERETNTVCVSLGSLPKVRCATCSMKDPGAGDQHLRMQLIESPLLTRNAVSKSELYGHLAMLRIIWGGRTSCPFHGIKNYEVRTKRAINATSYPTTLIGQN